MTSTTELKCRCGKLRLTVEGTPIASVECCCSSCRNAAARLQGLADAQPILTQLATTPFVLVRKDRVHFLTGQESLAEFRLSPQAKTRRAIAACCNTLVFLEFKGGHWLSLYGQLWPDGTRPRLEMRTMVADSVDAASLPNDVPNLKNQSLAFFARLFAAWARMGFRSPRIDVKGQVNA